MGVDCHLCVQIPFHWFGNGSTVVLLEREQDRVKALELLHAQTMVGSLNHLVYGEKEWEGVEGEG